MKFTRFFKLRRAISELDINFLANRMSEIESCLSDKGIPLEPENTAFTQEGIYYIHPESGMATRVVLYDSDYRVKLKTRPKIKHSKEGYTDQKTFEKFSNYHLMRCNSVTDAESSGWKGNFRVAQRTDPSFYFRIVDQDALNVSERDIYQEIENQRLLICPRCFMKINSLLEGVHQFKRESFELKYFFDVDFFGAWCRYGEVMADGTLSLMYPKDWEEICRIRKDQVQYHCEGCEQDFSAEDKRDDLLVYPSDYKRKNIGYVKLECLCRQCSADLQLKQPMLYQEELPVEEDQAEAVVAEEAPEISPEEEEEDPHTAELL